MGRCGLADRSGLLFQRNEGATLQENTILKIEHVSKFYPGVTALKDVSFTLNKGEVRALVGENGAGKSTLIKCIMGVEKPDEGKITMNYNGEWVVNATAVDAQAHGVFANYQHVNIAPDLSIAENYFLGRQPKTKLGRVDWKKMARDSKKIIDKFEMGVDPLAKIRELPIAMQAMVTISKISVNEDIRLVIFDEPTALRPTGIDAPIHVATHTKQIRQTCHRINLCFGGRLGVVIVQNLSGVNAYTGSHIGNTVMLGFPTLQRIAQGVGASVISKNLFHGRCHTAHHAGGGMQRAVGMSVVGAKAVIRVLLVAHGSEQRGHRPPICANWRISCRTGRTAWRTRSKELFQRNGHGCAWTLTSAIA